MICRHQKYAELGHLLPSSRLALFVSLIYQGGGGYSATLLLPIYFSILIRYMCVRLVNQPNSQGKWHAELPSALYSLALPTPTLLLLLSSPPVLLLPSALLLPPVLLPPAPVILLSPVLLPPAPVILLSPALRDYC